LFYCFSNIISKNNNVDYGGQSGITIYESSNLLFTDCKSYDDRFSPIQAYGLALVQGNSGITLANCTLAPNKHGEIYNPNNIFVNINKEKMLAKL